MQHPLVSVIIATHNRPERLTKALSSIAAQTIGSDNVEAVVVNDGGPSVADLVRAHSDTLNIRLTELPTTGGVSHARNVAIDLTAGKYISFLDDDDLFAPDHLATALGPLESGEAGFVYSGAIVSDRWLEPTIPADISEFPLKAYPYNRQVLQVANYLHTGSVTVRNFKDTAIRFDEELIVCEDWDCWIALTNIYKGMSIDKITSIYHQVKDFKGLVADGQMTVPTKFQLATWHIQAKWSSEDPLVNAYREWMREMEDFRTDLVRANKSFNFNFDHVLKYLYARISLGEMPNSADVPAFFAE